MTVLYSPSQLLAADDPPPALFNAVCIACHGPAATGNVTLLSPQIAGQESWYIKRQLENYLDGRRGTDAEYKPGRQMALISAVIDTPQKLDALADYLSRLQPEVKNKSVIGDLNRGQKLYAPCAVCHGSHAEGNEQLGGPRLRNLDDWYQIGQLQQFRTGNRGTAEGDIHGAQMRAAVQLLNDDADIRDVVAYITSLTD